MSIMSQFTDEVDNTRQLAVPRDPATCDGSWRHIQEAGDGKDTIAVNRCTGCGEYMVIIGYHYGYTGPAKNPQDAVRIALDLKNRR